MILKRISEIGIFIALAVFVKACYFLIWPTSGISSYFMEHHTLALFLDYGLLFVFQLLIIIYFYKKEFRVASIAWFIFFLINIRYVYQFLNYDFSALATDPNALDNIKLDVLVMNIASLAAAATLVVTNARSEMFLRIYGYTNVVLGILLLKQISNPRMDILQAIQIIGAIAPVFILAQFIKERRGIAVEESKSDIGLLDDVPLSFVEEEE